MKVYANARRIDAQEMGWRLEECRRPMLKNQFSLLLGVHPASLRDYEAGRVQSPPLDYLVKTSQQKDISLETVVFGECYTLPAPLAELWEQTEADEQNFSSIRSLLQSISNYYQNQNQTQFPWSGSRTFVPKFSSDKLALRLAQIRSGLGMTQEQFADELGYSSDSVSAWENNARTPKLEIISVYADIGNCSLDDLVIGFNRDFPAAIRPLLSGIAPSQYGQLFELFCKILETFLDRQ